MIYAMVYQGQPEFHADAQHPFVASFTCPLCRTKNWIAAGPDQLLQEPQVRCRKCDSVMPLRCHE
jgi:hypothetical protein